MIEIRTAVGLFVLAALLLGAAFGIGEDTAQVRAANIATTMGHPDVAKAIRDIR